MPIPLPLEALIPHRAPLCFIDAVEAVSEETCTATFTPQAEGWYADASGHMPAWFALEVMAQTIAAYSGYRHHAKGLPPQPGYLLGTRSLRCQVPTFAPGQCLTATARLGYADESGLSAFDCQLFLGEACLATATLKVFEAP